MTFRRLRAVSLRNHGAIFAGVALAASDHLSQPRCLGPTEETVRPLLQVRKPVRKSSFVQQEHASRRTRLVGDHLEGKRRGGSRPPPKFIQREGKNAVGKCRLAAPGKLIVVPGGRSPARVPTRRAAIPERLPERLPRRHEAQHRF